MSDKLRSRVLVAFMIVPGQLLLILLGGHWFSAFVLVIMLLAAMEMIKLVRHNQVDPPLTLLNAALILIFLNSTKYLEIPVAHIAAVLCVITCINEIFRQKPHPLENIATIIFGFVWIGLMMGSLIKLRNHEAGGYNIGFELTLSLMVSIWLCDTAAYFMGKRFGKRKILPQVSPKKTWVGCTAGLVSSIITMILFYFAYHPLGGYFFAGHLTLVDVILLGMIYGVIGQTGDFTESLLKRESGIKDSGSMLKAHGGILDRFDSLTFTAPVAYLYAFYFIR